MIVITEEVENPVNQAERKLILDTLSMDRSLPDDLLGRYHHITEKPGMEAPVRTFVLGEREYIGGIIALQVLPVEFPDPVVVQKEETEFPLSDPLPAQNPTGQRLDSLPVQA